MSKYLIHTCKSREWYVDRYLVPSMLVQGIPRQNISKYVDDNKGLLQAFVDSGRGLTEDTWHLQDDIILSSKFREQTEANQYGIVCGFCNGYSKGKAGYVGLDDMWYSMPCIRIPKEIMSGFIKWIDSPHVQDKYQHYIQDNKHDDVLLHYYLTENCAKIIVLNLFPNIVNHIDHLIGGSVVNQKRKNDIDIMAKYWEEPELIDLLKRRLQWEV